MFDLISVSEALKLSYESKGRLIDVRSEEAFRKGHLPMAENVEFEKIMSGQYKPPKEALFLYCDTGSNSMLAAKKLDLLGAEAYSVVGGIMFYKGYLEREENDLWTMVRASDRL